VAAVVADLQEDLVAQADQVADQPFQAEQVATAYNQLKILEFLD
jgi:hypothetical protein